MAKADASLGKQVFYIPQTQRKTNIHDHRDPDHFG